MTESERCELVLNAVFYWEPVEFFQKRCNMITLRFCQDEPSGVVLDLLYARDLFIGYTCMVGLWSGTSSGWNNAWWVCGQGSVPEGTMHGGSVVRDQFRKEQCMVGLWSGTSSGWNNAWWVCGQGPVPEGTMHGGSAEDPRPVLLALDTK